MSSAPRQIEQQSPPEASGFSLGLARVFWTILGPLFLLGILIQNLANPGGWLSGWDLAVALVVAAMIGCRWLEQRSGKATTAYGDPSTPKHFRRYALALIVLAGVGWALANILGNYVLS